jgi:hypothetical protein
MTNGVIHAASILDTFGRKKKGTDNAPTETATRGAWPRAARFAVKHSSRRERILLSSSVHARPAAANANRYTDLGLVPMTVQ